VEILKSEQTELGNLNLAQQRCREQPAGDKPGIRSTPMAIWALGALVLPLIFACCNPSIAQSKGPTEYEIKAAFLYNFAKFIAWPPSAFNETHQQFSVCVLGPDPFGKSLEDAVLGKTIAERSVILTRARQLKDLPTCHILFVSAAENSHLLEIAGGSSGHNALLVGESEGFASAGGAVQFVLDQNHVRFAINPEAANRAGLKISSKLLALATIVHDAGRDSQAKN
jgi:hypothetical protein